MNTLQKIFVGITATCALIILIIIAVNIDMFIANTNYTIVSCTIIALIIIVLIAIYTYNKLLKS